MAICSHSDCRSDRNPHIPRSRSHMVEVCVILISMARTRLLKGSQLQHLLNTRSRGCRYCRFRDSSVYFPVQIVNCPSADCFKLCMERRDRRRVPMVLGTTASRIQGRQTPQPDPRRRGRFDCPCTQQIPRHAQGLLRCLRRNNYRRPPSLQDVKGQGSFGPCCQCQ